MRRRWLWLPGLLLLLGGMASASEAGARLRLEGDDLWATGWVALSEEWAGVEFSGRCEADLLSVDLRSASGTARVDWGWAVARATVAHSAGGSTQLVSQLEAETSIDLDRVGFAISGGWQARASWTHVGRGSALTTWGSVRTEALPWWAEGRLDVSWPWTGARWSLAVGLEREVWFQVRVEGGGFSLHSAGLELGAESGRWSTSTHWTVLPGVAQGMTVRWGDDELRLHTRIGLRSRGTWSAQVGATGRAGSLRWGGWLDLGPGGWWSTSVEARLVL